MPTKSVRTKKNKPSIGLTVFTWTVEQLKDGVELFEEYKMVVDPKSNATVRRDLRKLREICIGIVGTNNARDWYRVCRAQAPVGCILEDFDEHKWENVYQDTVSLVRVALTKALLLERNQKSAKILLDVLERRNSELWKKQETGKAVSVTQTDNENKTTSITFQVVG